MHAMSKSGVPPQSIHFIANGAADHEKPALLYPSLENQEPHCILNADPERL